MIFSKNLSKDISRNSKDISRNSRKFPKKKPFADNSRILTEVSLRKSIEILSKSPSGIHPKNSPKPSSLGASPKIPSGFFVNIPLRTLLKVPIAIFERTLPILSRNLLKNPYNNITFL